MACNHRPLLVHNECDFSRFNFEKKKKMDEVVSFIWKILSCAPNWGYRVDLFTVEVYQSSQRRLIFKFSKKYKQTIQVGQLYFYSMINICVPFHQLVDQISSIYGRTSPKLQAHPIPRKLPLKNCKKVHVEKILHLLQNNYMNKQSPFLQTNWFFNCEIGQFMSTTPTG